MPPDVLLEVPLEEVRRSRVLAREVGGQEILVLATREGVRVYSGVCPHLAGPLLRARVEAEAAGVLRIVCPWHRYAFDAADGRCLTRPGGPWRGLAAARPAAADLRLTPLPFEVEDECVRVLAGRR